MISNFCYKINLANRPWQVRITPPIFRGGKWECRFQSDSLSNNLERRGRRTWEVSTYTAPASQLLSSGRVYLEVPLQ